MSIKKTKISINYLEDDTGTNTRITMYNYKRPRPNGKIVLNDYGFITLPLPVSMPNDEYSMNVGAVNLGLAGNALNFDVNKVPDEMTDTIAERIGLSGNSSKEAKRIVGGLAAFLAASPGVSDLLSRKSGLPAISETAQALTGIVQNPHTALLFNGVNLRTFTFSWRLSPRSADQSRKLNSIINALKRAMHPDLIAFNFALDYPDLFRITFNNDKEGIVEVDYSFLRSMSVNPTPAGHAYYKEGYPAVIDLSLTFEEIAIKTSESFGGSQEIAVATGDSNPINLGG
jgi:hypothetical protein